MLIPPEKSLTGFDKSEFLTIPDAPNYEINGYFKVRNKATGHVLTNQKRVNRPSVVTTVWHNNKEIKRDVKTFYHQAAMAILFDEAWQPVPSLNNLYELNVEGRLRNAATKKLLKPVLVRNYLHYRVLVDNKVCRKRVGALLEEVFGILSKRKTQPIPVILRKDGGAYYFKSIKAGAQFLQRKVFFCADWISKKMNKRCHEICGWQVQYLR